MLDKSKSFDYYKNAGGTLNSNGVEDVIGALKTPLSITGGTDYTAYNGDPERQVTVGSETFALAYDPNAGFSYISGVGDALSFDGGLGASGDGDGYPFDITDPVALAQAVEDFNALAFDDPARQAYLDAFNAARSLGTVPAADLTAMDAALTNNGAVQVDGEWVMPPFDYTDADALATGMENIEALRGTADYAAAIAALKAGQVTNPSMTADLNSAIIGEFQNAVTSGDSGGVYWNPLTGVNFVNGGRPLRGVSMPWTVPDVNRYEIS